MTLKLLITGFGRFPGAPSNPSGTLALRLARLRRPAFGEVTRIAHVFKTSYADVDRELPALIARHRPDGIVMFGLATRAKRLRIEIQARNRMSVLFPDADGFVPAAAIALGGAGVHPGNAPFPRLMAAAKSAGAKAALSRNAGSYLCNYAYWRGLEAAAKPGGPRLVVFVHIPKMAAGGRRGSMTWLQLVRAGEAISAAAISALRRR